MRIMALRYCFEQSHVARTLARSKPHDLAVIDTEGCEEVVKSAVKRGVFVYGYLNAGALEKERSYYGEFKHLRLAPYDGWDGEFWIDPTDREWQQHLISEAKRMKKMGVIGLYLDNTDIYYMCAKPSRLKNPMRKVPDATAVYKALADIVLCLYHMGLIVMPNGGDSFVRRFVTEHPGVIQTINQEGLFYEDFKKQPKSETAYRKEYMKWAAKHMSGKIRGIEYCRKQSEILAVKAYYKAHGWDVYISKHKDLMGD
jgi:uncharacterized protein (TIGR01370 family)